MHYYQFNIGDYSSHTSRLSVHEDIAYRRLLDLYYLTERPLNGCLKDVAREIGMMEYLDDIEYILNKFFTKIDDEWVNNRCDKEIRNYQSKQKSASKAGKASAKARKHKASERTLNERTTSVQPNIKHKPINTKQEPITSLKINNVVNEVTEIFEYWKLTTGHTKSKLDDKRKKIIKNSLKIYPAVELKLAIKGCTLTPHNIGQNDRNEKYLGLHIIFKDADQIDRFIHNSICPPKIDKKQSQQEIIDSFIGESDFIQGEVLHD